MDEVFYNRHYITVDEQYRIVGGFSDAFREPTDTDICINERGGYQFRLFPEGEENPALFDWDGMIPLYKWENGEVVKRTEEEVEADRAALPVPEYKQTNEERIAVLEGENNLLKSQISAQSEQMDFYEDCIAEMAAIVYA